MNRSAWWDLRCLVFVVLLIGLNNGFAAEEHPDNSWAAAKLTVPSLGTPGFKRLESDSTGIDFLNLLDNDRSIRNRNLLSGSGVAAGDIDNDGWCDLYFCGLDNENKLYRNLGGWKFVDITSEAKVGCDGQDSTAAAFADVDGDGDLDLLVNSLGGGTRLFRNDTGLSFTEVTQKSGLGSSAGSMSMTLADIENDGDLDLYVANFHPTTIKDSPNTRIRIRMVNNRPMVASVNGVDANSPELKDRFKISENRNVLEYGEPDFLFINDGSGNFSKTDYLKRFLDENGNELEALPFGWGLAARFTDVNRDGFQDLYVCNDLFTPDRFWINDGTGRFKAIPKLALRNTSTFSMGVDFSDIDRDGDWDFFVVDMLSRDHDMRHLQVSELIDNNESQSLLLSRPQLSRNTLQVNRGDNTFAEIAQYSNVEASEWSWGPIFLDVDLDGNEDILVTNGQLRDFQNADMTAQIDAEKNAKGLTQSQILKLMSRFPDLRTPNVAFRNNGDGTFTDFSEAWGFDQPGISQGMALADLDNDGDMDVVMNNLLETAGIYQNQANTPRVLVRLAKGALHSGIGASIAINQNGVEQRQEIICAGRYLSSDQTARMFGVLDEPLDITIAWPSGVTQTIKGASPNHAYTISEPATNPARITSKPSPIPLFSDVSDLIAHKHMDRPFEDFRRQLLIPIKYSQPGPGVGWIDLNSDGWDDLLIGNGAGGRLAVFLNQKNGTFEPSRSKILLRTNWDQTMALPVYNIDGQNSLLVGVSNYESGSTQLPAAALYDFKNQKTAAFRLELYGSTGAMCQADLNGDGTLEMFVGGRIVPGHYPNPPDSVLLTRDNKGMRTMHRWEGLGMVQGALFSNLYGDHRPELIVTQHWGPIRVFTWEGKSFSPTEITARLGLDKKTGWWNGVATGDFNKDGKIDLVATNWGLNWRTKPSSSNPNRIYYGDFFGSGQTTPIEANLIEGKWKPVRRLGIVRAALPPITEFVRTFEEMGQVTVMDALGEEFERAKVLESQEFRSGIFLNSSTGKMQFTPLPEEAQWSTSFGVVVEDFNGDGELDLFLAQNFFGTNPEYSRCDSGRGLLLIGTGGGKFQTADARESGIYIYGEQRACAVSDFNQDGRMDLVVGQNSEATKLYLNKQGTSGLRVKLNGTIQNPDAIGSIVSASNLTREIQSGSGYWAHNSTRLVFSQENPIGDIHVTWPSGKRMSYSVPPNARSVQLNRDGTLQHSK